MRISDWSSDVCSSDLTAATAMPETLNKAPIAVVNEDRSPLSWRIVSAFYPPYFVLPEVIDQAEMDARMDASLDTFALAIPPNFQRDLLEGRRTEERRVGKEWFMTCRALWLPGN